ncbi:hypothetical protein AWB76_03587 [Caballeronia temeraria]|uniref:Lipoprotein n=1 Tax=Caballeronia temeraria TaxID=1777137 RepID=A0A158B5D3_9BURK|nr:hypothetical protein [Caballeronia temeraria]SAK64956.1 hypothetical protein AWB76_03587 [Caballeronia temeraria]
MLSGKQSIAKRAARMRLMPIVSLFIAAALSGCGGSDGAAGGGDIASVAKSAGAPEAASGAVAQTSNASSFFDGIFNTTSGAGYYIFGWNSILSPDTGGALGETGITRTRFGVIDGSDTTLRQSYVPLTGNDTLQYSKMVYITAEGAFPADSLPYDDLGPQTKIFQRLPDGFDFGVKGMSTPLYRVTFDVQDVSGQSVKSVVKLFQGGDPVVPAPRVPSPLPRPTSIQDVQVMVDYIANPLTVNMPRLVFPSSDATVMPAGSQVFVPTYTAQTQFLRVDLSRVFFNGTIQDYRKNTGFRPLTESIWSGGYQYASPYGLGLDNGLFRTKDGGYVVEYQGKVYAAELIPAGERLTAPVKGNATTTGAYHVTAPRPAFNKIAAAFLTRQLGTTPEQTHNVMYIPSSCYHPEGTTFTSSCGY